MCRSDTHKDEIEMSNKLDIVWEDEDTGFDEELKKKETSEKSDFEQLLNEQGIDQTQIKVGQKISGTISVIPEHSDDVLVELSSRWSGIISKSELFDEENEPKYQAGETIEPFVISRKGSEIQLSFSLSLGTQNAKDLSSAYENGIPIKGKVTKENKGGFEISIRGKTAFCPISQIDSRYVEDKAQWLGQELEFLIEKYENDKNIVVSRAKLIKARAAEKIKEIEANLNENLILKGKITEIRDYGAFVDLGGLEGFLHVSEISFSRVQQIRDYLQKGEEVTVKILKIEEDDRGKKRISLSIKAALDDPWTNAIDDYKEQESFSGKVVKIEKFGAFVELKPGIEGLIHISEMSWEKRIHHASDVVKVGDTVNVRLLSIDAVKQKISLSLKHVEDDPWQGLEEGLPIGSHLTAKVESLKGFGAILAIKPGITGLLPISTMKKVWGERYRKECSPPKEVNVTIAEINRNEKKILLSLPNIEEDEDGRENFEQYQAQQETQQKQPDKKNQGSFGDLLAAKMAEKNKQ